MWVSVEIEWLEEKIRRPNISEIQPGGRFNTTVPGLSSSGVGRNEVGDPGMREVLLETPGVELAPRARPPALVPTPTYPWHIAQQTVSIPWTHPLARMQCRRCGRDTECS